MAIEGVKIERQYQEFLDEHFSISPKWNDFHKKLKNKSFVTAVQHDTRSDDKLKAFVSAVAMREQAKGPTVKAPSDTSGTYKVRYHPDHDRFSCTCPDWTFKRSVSGSDCKHISRIKDGAKDSLMKKKANMVTAADVLFRIGRTVRQKEKNEAETQNLAAENAAYSQAYPRPSLMQSFLKKAEAPQGLVRRTLDANCIPPLLKEAYDQRWREEAEMAKKLGRIAKEMLAP